MEAFLFLKSLRLGLTKNRLFCQRYATQTSLFMLKKSQLSGRKNESTTNLIFLNFKLRTYRW